MKSNKLSTDLSLHRCFSKSRGKLSHTMDDKRPESTTQFSLIASIHLNSNRTAELKKTIDNNLSSKIQEDHSGVIQGIDIDFGLKKDKAAKKFAKRVKRNCEGDLSQRRDKLLSCVNRALTHAHVPNLKGLDLTPNLCAFMIQSWRLNLYNVGFDNRSDKEYMKWLVNQAYHEARHCEQFFLIARKRAGNGDDVSKLVRDMGMPLDIATKAVDKPLRAPRHAKHHEERLAKFESSSLWEDSIYGTKSSERTAIYRGDMTPGSPNHDKYLALPEEKDARDAGMKSESEYDALP